MHSHKDSNPVLEVAILDIKEGLEKNFEDTFNKAQGVIMGIDGYLSHELQKCIEKHNRYILLVRWKTLEAHTTVFRKSEQYKEWKSLLHHFYEPFPEVEHYQLVFGNST